MCTTCGCGADQVAIDGAAVAPHGHAHDHEHEHGHHHHHGHEHDHHDHDHDHDHHAHAPGTSPSRMVQVEQDILAKNDAFAARNRRHFADLGVFALNLVSSPGSGKTTLLCRTIQELRDLPVSVIEGDQQTTNDAERIRATGAPAVQVNTGKGCHLDAHMVGHALDKLPLAPGQLLMIENVGNLVCPAGFDLGEAHKVVILSVTEGEDKPLKYPHMFRAADVMILNKVDLLPYLQFDVGAAIVNARRVNPAIRVLQVSATTGQGLAAWLAFLREGALQAAAARQGELQALRQRVAQLEARLAS